MRSNVRRFLRAIATGMVLAAPASAAFGDMSSAKKLATEWWQWAVSIPAPVNPQLDTTGGDCMVGQRGGTWFLAGVYSGGAVERDCSVPDDVTLFFPIINSVTIDTPNVCGQGPDSMSVADMRAFSAVLIDGATGVSATLDGAPIKILHRVQSPIFTVALPEDNIFDAPCIGAGLGDVPAGIYGPSVDDGLYAEIKPLPAGLHVLQFHAENPALGFSEDVTYNLDVVATN